MYCFRPVVAIRLLSLLVTLLAACGGNREDNLRGACSVDGECPVGQTCQGGYCEDEAPVVGGGEVQVSAAARAEGVEAEVEVRVEGAGTCTDSTCTVREGATVIFTAPSVAGYRFLGWSGDPPCQGTELVIVLRNVRDDTMCIASYVRRLSVRGEIDGGGGTVAAESDAPLASCSGAVCEVDDGDTVTLTAPERTGFRFAGWEGEDCEDASGVQVRVTVDARDVVCTALYVPGFVIRGHTEGADAVVRVSSTSPTAVCAVSSCQVDAGASATISAPEVEGYRFVGFTGDAACVSSEPTISIESADANLTCVARYVRRFRVTGTAEGAAPVPLLQASSPDTFASCEGAACLVDDGGSATLFAPTVSGFRLRSWRGADCEGETGSAVTFEGIDHDIVCTAEYVRGVGVNGAASGADATVTATSGSPGASCNGASCALDLGGAVTLTTTEVTGFTFTGWTGDPGCASTALSFTIANVDGSKTCTARYTRIRFTVAAAVTPAASGVIDASSPSATATCSGTGCTVDYGSNVTLVARPHTGFDFVRWTGCSAVTTATLSLSDVTADASCTAEFARRMLTVSTAVAPASAGTVSTPCGAATCEVPYGGAIRLTATESNPAYRFSGWSGCASSGDAVLDLTNITSARSCTANFSLRTYMVSAAVGTDGGSVAPCGAAACIVNHGASITLVATPAAGYEFAGWEGSCSGASPSFPLTNITGTRACTANFRLRSYQVTASVGTGSGSVTPCSSAPCSADYGSSITLVATPAAGYEFAGWEGSCSGANPSFPLTNITGDRSCTANFRLRSYAVTATVSPAGVATVAPAACFGQACSVNHGASITLTPSITNTNYLFNGWTGCTGTVAANGALTLSNVTGNRTCTANFVRPTYTVTSSVSPAGFGTVTPCTAASPCNVPRGNSVTLTARPASAGCVFSRWSGCSSSTAATISFPVTGSVNCVANFTQRRVTIRVVTSPVTTTTTYSVVYGGSINLAVPPIPPGYTYFWRWTGCVSSPVFSDPLRLTDVTANMTCQAEYGILF